MTLGLFISTPCWRHFHSASIPLRVISTPRPSHFLSASESFPLRVRAISTPQQTAGPPEPVAARTTGRERRRVARDRHGASAGAPSHEQCCTRLTEASSHVVFIAAKAAFSAQQILRPDSESRRHRDAYSTGPGLSHSGRVRPSVRVTQARSSNCRS